MYVRTSTRVLLYDLLCFESQNSKQQDIVSWHEYLGIDFSSVVGYPSALASVNVLHLVNHYIL